MLRSLGFRIGPMRLLGIAAATLSCRPEPRCAPSADLDQSGDVTCDKGGD